MEGEPSTSKSRPQPGELFACVVCIRPSRDHKSGWGAIGSVLSGVARTATPGAKARLPRIHADQEVGVIRDHIPPRMRLAWYAGADDLRALLRVPVASEHPELHGATDCNRLRGRACVIELSRTLP